MEDRSDLPSVTINNKLKEMNIIEFELAVLANDV